MPDAEPAGRPNQRKRTRKDLLRAAQRLMKQGGRPGLDEVAEEAMVSRATAYRYFPGIDALLVEASLDIAFPEPADLFGAGASDDPVERLTMAEAAVHDMIAANETALRTMIAQSMERAMSGGAAGESLRQNRRTGLIEAAIEPARDRFDAAAHDRLVKALALVIGTEAMLVTKDVLELDDAEARAVKAWAIRALVDAAERGAR